MAPAGIYRGHGTKENVKEEQDGGAILLFEYITMW
jgi:hypothetical protein